MSITNSINSLGTLTRGKNDNARRTQGLPAVALKIPDGERAMLKRYGMISKYVFPNRVGVHITLEHLRDAWARYRQANGITGARTPYELWHTFMSVVDEMPAALK